MCGLIQRDTLPDVDIGFAFLPRYRAQGYALEAAQATVQFARNVLKLPRLAAITTPDNASSQKLLGKLGMHWVERGTFGGDEELDYFVMDFADVT